MWLALVAGAAFARPRLLRGPLGEGGTVVITTVLAAWAAWAIAFPQQNVDFDTWAELSRFRLHRTHELIKQHRPLQYYIEYWIVRGMALAQPDLRKCSAALCIFPLLAGFVLMVRFRRTLFCSPGVEYPVIAFLVFFVSPAGEFLIDSWNDHLPLVPFYIAGTAWVLNLRAQTRRAAVFAVAVFALESLLHSAEPWLWGAAAGALFFARRRPGTRMGNWKAVLPVCAAMLIVTLLILVSFPGGGGRAAQYVHSYAQKSFGLEALRTYADRFAAAGAAAVRARILFPVMGLLFALLGAMAFPRRSGRWLVWLALAGLAVLFPFVYETENPERYYTISLVWAMLGAVFVRRLLACRRRRAWRQAAPFLAAALIFLLCALEGLPRIRANLGEEHIYNRLGTGLARSLDSRGTLVVVPKWSFYLWAEYWFQGKVEVLDGKNGIGRESLAGMPEPVYLNAGAADVFQPKAALGRVFGLASDPATAVFRVRREAAATPPPSGGR